MKKNTKHLNNLKGFTLIELLVVIAIIGLLATMSVVALSSAREKARDSRRLSDVKQVQTALEMYYSENSSYPSSSDEVDLSTLDLGEYMDNVPSNPAPADDGDCPDAAEYRYESDGSTYAIMYCVGNQVSDVTAGTHCATQDSIDDGDVLSGGQCVGLGGNMAW